MKNFASRLFGYVMSRKFYRPVQIQLNKYFVIILKIDLTDFERVETYSSIQALFTRKLIKQRVFSSDQKAIISPTDSTIAQYGSLDNKTILQVKGLTYDLYSFLTKHSNVDKISKIENGKFINFYLSPKDYHHFHAPLNFNIHKIIHVPGTLFPVKKKSLETERDLFIKNERVILECTLDNNAVFYFVAIGAFNVGKIKIHAEDRLQTNNPLNKEVVAYAYQAPIHIMKGEDVGFFEMGSSVVLLFEENSVKFSDTLTTDRTISFGDNFAILN